MTASPKPTAAVTGASRGIGRATALELARRGYRVFALARAEDDLARLAADARQAGLDIEPLILDVADAESRERAVAAIREMTAGYGLDVLVNNAGHGQIGPIEEIPPDRMRRQFEVNVLGLLAFTQPFLPAMRERRRGRIVNLSSAAGRIVTPFMGAYCASKFALEAISDALRLELSPFGVRVILIEPGPIRTAFGEAAASMRVQSPSSPYAPYLRDYDRSRRGTNLFERSPEAVARVIARALEADHPRPRYTVTLPAKLGTIGRRVVPDIVLDWGFRLVMGLRR
ncbi:MAG: SDR family oxidoreductase [Chloroflexi bacterium]|nr:SDR family oxidoreductase [Chloroflexota bacterium]